MVSSLEIEVVPLDSKSHQNPAESQTITDVFSASAYGDLHQLKRFIEHNGSSVSLPDSNGEYAFQWDALNNSLDDAQYIIEHGGDINAADNVHQTPLHWAAVKGSIDVANLLLQNGARIEANDVNGFMEKQYAN